MKKTLIEILVIVMLFVLCMEISKIYYEFMYATQLQKNALARQGLIGFWLTLTAPIFLSMTISLLLFDLIRIVNGIHRWIFSIIISFGSSLVALFGEFVFCIISESVCK